MARLVYLVIVGAVAWLILEPVGRQVSEMYLGFAQVIGGLPTP